MIEEIGCLNKCGKIAHVRGVCYICRNRLAKEMRTDRSADARWIAAGRILPAKSRAERQKAYEKFENHSDPKTMIGEGDI